MNWFVTYEIVTEESAQDGDAAERGFLDVNGARIAPNYGRPTEGVDMTFRQAVDLWQRERENGVVEADSYPFGLDCPPRWFTDCGNDWDGRPETYSVSLHVPDNVTPSSRLRVARLVGCYGTEGRPS